MKNAFVLVPLNPNGKDFVGHEYPECGFVSCKTFTEDEDIRYGLFGYLLGKIKSPPQENPDDYLWAVVKIETDHNIIKMNMMPNAIKFDSGIVVKRGTLRECGRYMIAEGLKWGIIDPRDVAGSELAVEWENAAVHSYGSQVITKGVDCNAVALAPRSVAIAFGSDSTAMCFSKNSRAEALGEYGQAIAMGAASKAIASCYNGFAISVGIDGEAMAGERGTIILSYFDGQRRRYVVQYVGEDIEPCKMYKCDELGKVVLKIETDD